MSLWLGCRASRAAHFSLGSPLSGENFLGGFTVPTSTAFDGGLCCSWSMCCIDQEQRHPMPMGPVMKRLDRFDLCWPRRNPAPDWLVRQLGCGASGARCQIRNLLLSSRPASQLSVRGSRHHVHGVPMTEPVERQEAGWLVVLRHRSEFFGSHAVAT